MTNKLLSIFFCLFFLNSNAQFWQQISDFPATERDDPTTFVIGYKAYCGTGQKPFFISTNDFYSFDMTSDSWDTISSMPGSARQYAVSFSGLSSGYIFGGYDGANYFNDLYQYNPVTGNWLIKAALPAAARMGCASFVINNIAYIMGGRTASAQSIKEVWAYDLINDSWVQKADLPFGARWRSVAATINNKGFLGLGRDENNRYRNELFEYDPITDNWTQISTFPLAGRTYSGMVAYQNDLIVMAGLDSLGNNYNDVWRINPDSLNWQALQSLPSNARRGGSCFNSPTAIYYTTGVTQTGTRLKETWKLENPTSINEIANEDVKIICYPNPADHLCSLVLPEHSVYTIEVSDKAGRIISEFSTNQNFISIETWGMKNGLYILKIRGSSASYHSKMIVQH